MSITTIRMRPHPAPALIIACAFGASLAAAADDLSWFFPGVLAAIVIWVATACICSTIEGGG